MQSMHRFVSVLHTFFSAFPIQQLASLKRKTVPMVYVPQLAVVVYIMMGTVFATVDPA